MAFGSHNTEELVLANLNKRTLVDGRPVMIASIMTDLGISADEVRLALEALQQRGFVTLSANEEVAMTSAGHNHLATS